MATARSVPASHGLQWAREGLEIFAAAPLAWVGITILFLLIGIVLSAIPFAGMLWSVVVPIHVGGLMLGCAALREGRPLEVRYLFNGFEQPRVQPLALVGALYLAGSLVIMLPAIFLVVGSTLISAFAFGTHPTAGVALTSIVLVGVIASLLVAAGIVLSLALWFAPALVVFRQVAPLDALRASLQAGWQNFGAFVVYAVVLIGVGVIAMSPLLGAVFLVAARGDRHAGPISAMLIGGTAIFTVLCLFLFMPAAWGSMYASYRDVFEGADASPLV